MYLLTEAWVDAILVILYKGLLNTTTVATEWFNSLTFNDDIKCITANGAQALTVLYHVTFVYLE